MPPPISWSNVTVISASPESTSVAPTCGEVATIFGGLICRFCSSLAPCVVK